MRVRVTAIAKLLGTSPARLISTLNHTGVLVLSPHAVSEKLTETAQRLGMPRAAFVRLCARLPGLVTYRADRIESNATGIAEALAVDLPAVIRLATRAPAVLARSPESIAAFIDQAALRFDLPRATICKLILKCPVLVLQRVETLDHNISTLAELLALEREATITAALRLPQLFYLRPEKVAGRLADIASRLKLPVFLFWPGYSCGCPPWRAAIRPDAHDVFAWLPASAARSAKKSPLRMSFGSSLSSPPTARNAFCSVIISRGSGFGRDGGRPWSACRMPASCRRSGTHLATLPPGSNSATRLRAILAMRLDYQE